MKHKIKSWMREIHQCGISVEPEREQLHDVDPVAKTGESC